MATLPRPSPLSPILLALGMGCCAVGAWSWQMQVFRAPRIDVGTEPWDQVKQAYPIPEGTPEVSTLSTETIAGVLNANPFSPQRGNTVTLDDQQQSSGGSTAIELPPPVLIYKWRINLGQRQRAIMEDTTTKKTYFLEVGQEVATFKVLDITESQVLLSDPQTSEPIAVPLSSKKEGAGGVPSR